MINLQGRKTITHGANQNLCRCLSNKRYAQYGLGGLMHRVSAPTIFYELKADKKMFLNNQDKKEKEQILLG